MRLRDGKGSTVELGQVLGKGGEAEIWTIGRQPDSVAKIYFNPSAEQERKLSAMVAQPPSDPTRSNGHVSICWPTEILYDPVSGRMRGYIMPRMDRVQHRELFLIYNVKTRQLDAPEFSWAYLVTAAENISNVVDAIHHRGYVVGDMNESNFFISSQALATVIDCDSMQVATPSEVFRCTVGKPEYTAPELQGLDFRKCIRTEAQDNFALAVLLFHLLMEGFHPYAGKWNRTGESPSLEERISQGASPYVGSARISPSPAAPPFEILPKQIRELFLRAFYSGNENLQRPSAREWSTALHTLGQSLETCRKNRQHRYSKHLKRCPWCERKALLGGFDPFPLPGTQTALPRRPFRSAAAAAPVPGRPAARATAATQPSAGTTQGANALSAAAAGFGTALAAGLGATAVSGLGVSAARLRSQMHGAILRAVLWSVPPLTAFCALLMLSQLGLRSGDYVQSLWLLLAGAGALHRKRRSGFKAAVLFVFLCWILFKATALLIAALPAAASGLELLQVAALSFFTARSLQWLLRQRVDWYWLHRQMRWVAGLAAAPLAVPLLALGLMGGLSLAQGPIEAAISRRVAQAPAFLPPATGGAADAQLLTCASVTARCTCQAKTSFRRGETVSLLATSRSTPHISLQIEPTGGLPVSVGTSRWIASAGQFCSTTRYRIPVDAAAGFTHVHLSGLTRPGTPFRSETGYSVAP